VRQFYILLALSTVIATAGLLLNSTAVVIGAMLLSPLMTPMLAIAAAIVMGWPTRASRNMLRVAVATLYVFGIAYLLPALAGFPKELALSSEVSGEILSRTNPNIGDLLVALCAGVAAAYMMVRKEALSALPGVAISVALVPPLCVSGVLAYLDAWDLAWEAFVLYVTNLTAIVLMAGVVLLALGFKPKLRDRGRETRVVLGFAFAALLVLAVAVPLAGRGFADLRDAREQVVAARVIQEWIGDNDVELRALDVEDNVFRLSLRINVPIDALTSGQPLTPLQHADKGIRVPVLDDRLTTALGHDIVLEVSGSFGFAASTCDDPDGCG
jgi:uncharacterized hydrophobic protein (TIGR00271 family)